jgi:hypothetical protein
MVIDDGARELLLAGVATYRTSGSRRGRGDLDPTPEQRAGAEAHADAFSREVEELGLPPGTGMNATKGSNE